jgi:hypothetical protein
MRRRLAPGIHFHFTTHLRLNVGHFAPAELELVERDVGLPEVAEEAELLRPEDEEGVALTALAAGCPADTVDVLLRIVRRIKLKKIILPNKYQKH